MAIKTFTTGEVLTASDTNTYLANSGLVYVTTSTYTASAGISINGCFTSDYTNYKIVGSHIPNNSLANFIVRLRNGATDQTGANYQFTSARIYNTNLIDVVGNAQTSATFSNGGIASFPYCFTLDVYDPLGNTPTIIQNDATNFEGGVAAVRWWGGGGYKANYAADGITLFPNGGTTWTGSVTVFGFRKA